MKAMKLNDEILNNVTGGWDVSQFTEEEKATFYSIINRLEVMKDTGEGSQSEADELLQRLYDFEVAMAGKYGE